MSPSTHRRRGLPRRRTAGLAVAAALAVSGLVAAPQVAAAATDPGSPVKVNQVAYVPGRRQGRDARQHVDRRRSRGRCGTRPARSSRPASRRSRAPTRCPATRRTSSTSRRSTPRAPATCCPPANASSYPFDISADPVKRLRYDSLAFFYHQRSGIAIDAQYVGSTYARAAGHLGVAPNQGDNERPVPRSRAATPSTCAAAGTTRATTASTSSTAASPTWQLQNAYERTLYVAGADKTALGDGTWRSRSAPTACPTSSTRRAGRSSSCSGCRCRPAVRTPGMVHHKIHDENWTGLPTLPAQDSQRRLLSPVSTAATLNLAAVAAQASRLWKTLDPTFSAKALAAAQKAYTAAKANPNRIAVRDRRHRRRRLRRQHRDRRVLLGGRRAVRDDRLRHLPRRRDRLVAVQGRQLRAARLRLGLDRRARRHHARAGPERAAVRRRRRHPRGHRDVRRRGSDPRRRARRYPAPEQRRRASTTGARTARSPTTRTPSRSRTTSPARRSTAPASTPRSTTSRAATRSTSPTSPATARRRSRTCTTGSGRNQAERVPADRAARLVLRRPEQRAAGPDRRGAARRLRGRRSASSTTSRRTRSTRSRSTGTPRWPGWPSWAAEHAGSDACGRHHAAEHAGHADGERDRRHVRDADLVAVHGRGERDRAVRRRARRRGLARRSWRRRPRRPPPSRA